MYKSRKFKIAVAGVTALIFLATFVLFANSRATLNLSFLTNLFGNSNVQGVSTSVTTVKPTLDTFVRSAYPTKNYEGGSEIVSDGDPRVNSLLRFDLSNVNLSNVTKAELSITSTLSRKVNKTIKLITSGWTASSVTWNTSPTFGATLGTISGEIKDGITKNYTLDLAQVKAAGSALNIAIDDTSSGDSMTFKSVETGTPGAVLLLTVTSTTPTTPTEPTQPSTTGTTTGTTTTGTTTTGGSTTTGTTTTGTTTTGGSTTTGTTTGGTTTGGTTTGGTTTPTTPIGTAGSLWISQAELDNLDPSGSQWDAVYSVANQSWGSPNIADQDSNHDQYVMAGAIVCKTTGEFCDKTKAGILSAMGTEGNTRWLAVGRNLLGYTIAADIMGMKNEVGANKETVFNWLKGFLTRLLPDNNTGVPETLQAFESGSNASAQEASVYASIAVYSNDKPKLDYVWNRFRLYSCDLTSPETVIDLKASLDKNWGATYIIDDSGRKTNVTTQCAVAPKGSYKTYNGKDYSHSGAVLNDIRRGGTYQWTPKYTSYPWVGIEGYVPTALILNRQGYKAFDLSHNAVLRVFQYLWDVRTASGNEAWFDGVRGDEGTFLVNKYYGTNYPIKASGIGAGRTYGFTGFTHAVADSLGSRGGGGTTPPANPDPVTPVGTLTARITATPTSGVAPLTVAFSATTSTTSSDATITGYLWTFDDGSTSTSATVSHVFNAADEYNVTLRVTDSKGATNEISKSIVATAPTTIAVPVITSPLPTGELLHSVTSATISVKTDIAASCKFSTTDTNFTYNTSGTTFSNTGGTTHTHQVSGLSSGKSYSYYVKCQTALGGITALSKIIEFRVATAPTSGGGGSTGPIVVQSPYGVYPNCIAPGVPIESQEWWQEDKNPLPTDTRDLFAGSRHVHVGVCAPNARTMADTRTFGGVQDFVAVVVLHNNPSGITWVAAGFQGNDAGTKYVRTVTENGTKSTDWVTQSGECSGGSVSCVNFRDPLYCSVQQHTCTYQIPLRIDMRTCEIDGMCELRIRPNLGEVEPRNERAFTTLNAQINIGGGAKYRSSPAPIGRGWYTQLDYANASIDNYMDLYKGDFTKSVPVVSGTIKLNVRHREAASGGKSIASLRIDPSAHSGNVGTLVYEKPINGSLNMDNVEIDTTKLTNGHHVLFVTTQEQNDLGKNLGQLRLFINVQN